MRAIPTPEISDNTRSRDTIAYRTRQCLSRGGNWRASRSTSGLLGNNRYTIFTARQELNSIQLLSRQK